MTRKYNQMHRTEKYSQHRSIIWPVWLSGWEYAYEISGCGFESNCSHLNFRFRICFEQGVPRLSGIECGFTLKRMRDMTRTYSQKFSKCHSKYLTLSKYWKCFKLHVGAKSKILVEKKILTAPVWSNGEYPQLPVISDVSCIKTCCHTIKSIQDLKLL